MNLLYNTYASGSDNSWAISGAYGNVNGQPGRSNRGTYYGGEAMQHTNSGMSDYSNHSDYSNISHGSSSSHGTSTTQNTSCGSWDSQWPPALTAGAEYPGAEIDHGFAQLKFENITEVEPVPFEPPRDTPSSLGWSLDTEYLGHYKLVYHKASPSYLCLELLPEWEISPKTPKIVYLDVHLNVEDGHRCMYPNSCGKTFCRPADLERHYADVHDAEGLRKEFYCSYTNCNRSFKQIKQECTSSRKAFSRKDHYRDHLRDFHKEDLGTVKKPKNYDEAKDFKAYQKAQALWWKERRIFPTHWRCNKGLHTVQIAKYGWICPTCNERCHNDRIEARRKIPNDKKSQQPSQQPSQRPYQQSSQQLFDHYAGCTVCDGHGTIPYGQELVPCSNCQQYLDATYEDYPVQTTRWHDWDAS